VVVEGAGADAEQLGDRSDAVLGIGQHVPGRAEDLRCDDGGASADPAAGAGRGQAFTGVGDDQFPENSAIAPRIWKNITPTAVEASMP
jgi:hypothetical protein